MILMLILNIESCDKYSAFLNRLRAKNKFALRSDNQVSDLAKARQHISKAVRMIHQYHYNPYVKKKRKRNYRIQDFT